MKTICTHDVIKNNVLTERNKARACMDIHCLSKKKGSTLVGPPFALVTEHICCGIVSTTLCNVTTFISIQSCIHFWDSRFCIDDRRVKPFLQSFPLHPKDFQWGKVRTLWWPIHVWKWLLMLHSFTTRAQWILALSSWNMPEPSGKKKSIDGITWSFSTFRNSADLLCLDLTNWSNPRL